MSPRAKTSKPSTTSKKPTGRKSATTSKAASTENSAEKKLGPFDFINTVLQSKTNLVRGSENEELAEKAYNAFLTNKALSFHVDTVLYSNEMNRRGGLDNLLQYEYYLHSVRSMRRGYSWPKKSKDEDLEVVQQAYKVNPVRAQEIIGLIGPEGLAAARKKLATGGKV